MERDLINDFLSATTISEVNALVFQYVELLDENRSLYKFPRAARKRINNLRRELIRNTEIQYLN